MNCVDTNAKLVFIKIYAIGIENYLIYKLNSEKSCTVIHHLLSINNVVVDSSCE